MTTFHGCPEQRGTKILTCHLTREADAELRKLAGHRMAIGRTISQLILSEVARREERAKIQAEQVQTDGCADSGRI